MGAQTMSDEVLAMVLTEIKVVLNFKPRGYVSTDVANMDPVSLNYLLMGRPDPTLPLSVYSQSQIRLMTVETQPSVSRPWAKD